MIGFVDDTNGSATDFMLPHALPPDHCVSLTTHDAECWNDMLQLSGEPLKETKCSYHFLYYSFTSSGIPNLCGGTFNPTI